MLICPWGLSTFEIARSYGSIFYYSLDLLLYILLLWVPLKTGTFRNPRNMLRLYFQWFGTYNSALMRMGEKNKNNVCCVPNLNAMLLS